MKLNVGNISQQNKNVILNMIGAFLVKGGSLIISVILFPLYLNFFENQEVLGIWYTILSLLNWIIVFDLGLGQGLRNQLPPAIEENNRVKIHACISTTYILMTLVALVISVVGYFVIPLVNWNDIFNIETSVVSNDTLVLCVRIIFVGIMLQIVLKIIASILYALQKSAMVNLLALSSNVIILIALIFAPAKDISSNLITMSIINVVAANLPYVVTTIVVFSSILKDSIPSLRSFSRKYVHEIWNIGMSLLWLQIVFMVVSSCNEFLITSFTDPANVVEYQAYYKIFKTAAMIVSLALTPIWSAVTKAQAQNNYKWILKIYKIFLIGTAACFVAELCIIPFLQFGMNLWLGQGVIEVKNMYAVVFVFSSVIFVLHNVNTAIGNGLSYFKIQMIWMTVAAVVFVPLSYFIVRVTGSWIGVVIANVLSMLPYEVLAPIFTIKLLKARTK